MRKARRRSAMVAALPVMIMLAAWPGQAIGAGSSAGLSAVQSGEPKWVPGELIVRFRPGVDAAQRAAVRADGDAQLGRSLPLRGVELLRLAPGESVRAAAA